MPHEKTHSHPHREVNMFICLVQYTVPEHKPLSTVPARLIVSASVVLQVPNFASFL